MSADLHVYRLSNKARAPWAKTGAGELSHEYEPLYVHMVDTAGIACLIWDKWLSASTRNYICDAMNIPPSLVRNTVMWLAMIHDIGKATPAFSCKVQDLAEKVGDAGLGFSELSRTKRHSHAFLGQVILHWWLESRRWCPMSVAAISSIVGNHHGASPSQSILHEIECETSISPNSVIGDKNWHSVQGELLSYAFDYCHMENAEPFLSKQPIGVYAQVLITGLVIMSDWIASNVQYFPLIHGLDESESYIERAHNAWRSLDLPSPCSVPLCALKPDELFDKRFGKRLSGANMHEVQKVSVEIAQSVKEPGILIVEAPMGSGKTELAFLCAEVLMGRFNLGGVGVFLPTMATSNAMFSRVIEWISNLPLREVQSIRLLHGKAALNQSFAGLATWRGSWMGDEAGDEDRLIAHQWFGGSKRALLSSFVVGTVDQLLMSALRIKHVHLRHLGLAGKVIVIDEVHAYDAYMSTYLDRVLSFLGQYNVPVILLSATLPPTRRAELISAYRGMRKKSRRYSLPAAPRKAGGMPAYPLVSYASRNKMEQPLYIPCDVNTDVRDVLVTRMEDDEDTLLRIVSSALEQGGCICVLRDTVSRAQKTYELLREKIAVRVVLVHSRYIACDRAENDAMLVELLGPDQASRPSNLVVVATQVVEQSLDIDFDLLITDIAPIDMLLQRMGRLHRHNRGKNECLRPPKLRHARCYITGVDDWSATPPVFSRGITSVYQPAILMRTIAALSDLTKRPSVTVQLPMHIAPLVESVYEKLCPITEAWEKEFQKSEKRLDRDLSAKQERARCWLLGKPSVANLDDWIQGSVSLFPETQGRAAVRDSEESLEVVLVHAGKLGPELLPWVAKKYRTSASLGNGTDTPDDDVAKIAAQCTVALPLVLSMPNRCEQIIRAIVQAFPYSGWQESRWLRDTIPLGLDDYGEVDIRCDDCVFTLRYERTTGLELIVNKEVNS